MVDIQSATAEIRRGKKEEGKKEEEETTGQKYNGLPYYIGWPPPVDGQSPASQPRPLAIYGAQF